MRNKKGFTLVEVISAIVILSIIITLGVFSITKVRSNILEKQYKNIKLEIELAAEKYYSDTESKEVYVDTLIKEGYLKADNKSMTIIDPRDKTILNCYIVAINDDEKGSLGIENNVLENGNCNENAIVNSKILIVGADGNKINKTWYKNPITLNVKFTDSEKDPNNYSYTWKSDKNPNSISNEMIYNLQTSYLERGKVIDDEFYVTLVNGDEILESKGQRVRIDGVAPEFISVNVEAENEWKTQKVVTIDAEDQGSGIDGYIVSEDDCINKDFGEYTEIEVTNPNKVKIKYTVKKNGTYSICLKDKAGNVKKYDEDVIITKIDTTPPKCEYLENYTWSSSNVDIKYGCKEEHPNDTNQSGCSKVIKNTTTLCVNKETCYYERAQTFIKTTDMANIKESIGTFTIEDIAGNKVECPTLDKPEVSVKLDKTKPEISSVEVASNDSRYKSIYTTVTITSYDLHSGVKEMCASNSSSYSNCNWVNVNGCSKSENTYTCNIQLTINSYEGSGDNKTVYAYVKDNAGNIQSKTTNYKLYTTCTHTNFNRYGSCSKECDGGVYYEYRTDKYLGTNCNGYGNTSCNTMSCCSWTYQERYSTGYCDASCGWGSQRITYKIYSRYDDSYCGRDYDYEDCYDDSDCYEPDPDPGYGGGGSSGGSDCDTINDNRCDRSADTLYWISDCCDGVCNYAARAGSVAYGTISRSRLSAASNCSSYGEPPAPSKPSCYYVNVGCAGNGQDTGTTNCTCGYGYGGYTCGCKCPRGCVE